MRELDTLRARAEKLPPPNRQIFCAACAEFLLPLYEPYVPAAVRQLRENIRPIAFTTADGSPN